jgi:cytochrome c553
MRTPSTKALVILFLSVSITIAAVAQQKDANKEEQRAENLKVLPKSMNHDSLIKLMREYSFSLGVRCGFCHASSASDKNKLDFASDENKHKLIARDMMRMTAKINRKYFEEDLDRGKARVTCYTCHHGHEEPEAFVMPKIEEKPKN